jgi:hypothetical protein
MGQNSGRRAQTFAHKSKDAESEIGTFATCQLHRAMSASLIGHLGSSAFRLSTTTVSMSLTGSCFSSESAPRPFHHGIRGRVEQSFGRPYRQSNGRSKRTCELTSSIVPRGTSSTARWNSSFLLSGLILNGFHAAAATCSRVHRNSVPSTQMRCMMTANRRAKATIAFFIPRRLAICMAQALSHDHFFERSMLCAAS